MSERFGYAVTLHPVATTGVRAGSITQWVATEERAREIVDAFPTHRSFEAVPWEACPPEVRTRLTAATGS